MHVDKCYLCVCSCVCVYIHVVLPVNHSFAEEGLCPPESATLSSSSSGVVMNVSKSIKHWGCKLLFPGVSAGFRGVGGFQNTE